MGGPARGAVADPAGRRDLHGTRRGRLAAAVDALDPAVSDRGRRARAAGAGGRWNGPVPGVGRRCGVQHPPLPERTEITGPLAAKLFVSSTTTDADLFLVVRVYSPSGEEVVFQGALDPHTPVGQGRLRASPRRLDPGLSTPYRPFHPHDRAEPLEPGAVYELDIEIFPTSLVIPAGYRLGLQVRGRDYVYPGPSARLSNLKNDLTGCGPFLHDDPADRPPHGGRARPGPPAGTVT
ncbi:CocE/NonD family hydrolase C-terminal non-catalytic domain-containing protein [Streptomyces sp. NPDC059883]|uniref:CocE/NonD family hydrolase C-terminal non-catalytic domain-containing protein n=1 Tax=unclassified Streptomyces TaxID=2593676 RepID=UPI003646B7D9